MKKSKGKSEIEKLEKKLSEIRDGKWNESPERIKKLEARLNELKWVWFMDTIDPRLFNLIPQVDITTPEKLKAFKEWQNNDGTVEGLQKLLDNQNN